MSQETIVENPHQKQVDQVLEKFEVKSANGLNESQVQERRKKFGPNRLAEHKQRSIWEIIWSQINNPVVYLLMVAATLSFVFGDIPEGIAIVVVLILNAVIGFWMEFQARQSMKALRNMDKMTTRVRRDGEEKEIDAEDLVPGDIIILESGNLIPADARIIDEAELTVDESPLTGESVPVEKSQESLENEDVQVADRTNMLYKGTAIQTGKGTAVIVATGMETEIGNISSMVSSAGEEEIPLNKKLQGLTKKLIWFVLGLAALFFLVGWLVGEDIYQLVQTSIAWTIAAIPEGLPIVASIALAKGMLRLAKFNVIVKKLASVETLGETTIIFTDKTGTLTMNKLTVKSAILPDQESTVKWKDSEVSLENEEIHNNENFKHLYKISVYCNDANIKEDKEEGDPLEISLLKFTQGLDQENYQKLRDAERAHEDPFDSKSKMMGTIHKEENYYVAAKGATEAILGHSVKILEAGEVKELSEENRQQWVKKNDELSAEGLRVLAFGYRTDQELSEKDDFIDDLIFVGLIAFLDPPREDVPEAVQKCRDAGIEVIMVTGDHPETARKIAYEVNLIEKSDGKVLHGKELAKDLNEAGERNEEVLSTRVFSRVDPAQKLDLVEHYQNQNEIVAMTGDGVNDAPALKKADIGIAMGKKGTQVAQEVADMVLKDDSFPSIVHAIEQGRIIFENIRKFVMYQLSYHLSEILVIAAISFSVYHLPLLPLQLLFINLISDVFPALALGISKGTPNVMKHPPKDPSEPVLPKRHWFLIAEYGVVISIFVIGAYFYGRQVWGLEEEILNNIAFFTMAFAQLWHVFDMREADEPVFNNQVTRNKYVWFALLFCWSAILAAYFIPGLSDVLSLQELPTKIWVLIGISSLLPMITIQILKSLFEKPETTRNK